MKYKTLYEEERCKNAQLETELQDALEAVQNLWEGLQFAVLHLELNADLIDQYKALLDTTSEFVAEKAQ